MSWKEYYSLVKHLFDSQKVILKKYHFVRGKASIEDVKLFEELIDKANLVRVIYDWIHPKKYCPSCGRITVASLDYRRSDKTGNPIPPRWGTI